MSQEWSGRHHPVEPSSGAPIAMVNLYELIELSRERDKYKLERGFAIIIAVLTTIGWGLAAL